MWLIAAVLVYLEGRLSSQNIRLQLAQLPATFVLGSFNESQNFMFSHHIWRQIIILL